MNPTTVAVNYTIACKDKTGATSIPLVAESLPAGQSKIYGVSAGSSPCVSSHGGHSVTADSSGYSAGMVKCQKMAAMYVPVSQAGQLCAAGYRMCSLQEFIANKGTATNLRGVVSAATFSSSTDSGTTWQDRALANDEYPYVNDMYSMHRCATGASGTGTVVAGCESRLGTSSVEQAYCCPDTVVDQCAVEITTTSGHLQSPQFKGGSPF